MTLRSIAVVGVGAIGGAVAADLAELGHEVVLCSRSPFDRLIVTHPDGVSRIETPGFTDPSQIRFEVDWIVLATKAHQSTGAQPWFGPLCSNATRIAILQNGVDHVARLQPILPAAARLVPVVVQLPAEKTAPGVIEQTRSGALFSPDSVDGCAFASLFVGGRTKVVVREDFLTQSWWKLLSNAAIGGICALTLQPNRAVSEPGARELALALMREIVEVGRAEGADLPSDAPEKVLGVFVAAAPDHWSSISVDRREGRAMEWEVRNAIVGQLGRKHGIETPLNDAIVALLRLADVGSPIGSSNAD
jgi:2-dehydropantoate 2-reductase